MVASPFQSPRWPTIETRNSRSKVLPTFLFSPGYTCLIAYKGQQTYCTAMHRVCSAAVASSDMHAAASVEATVDRRRPIAVSGHGHIDTLSLQGARRSDQLHSTWHAAINSSVRTLPSATTQPPLSSVSSSL